MKQPIWLPLCEYMCFGNYSAIIQKNKNKLFSAYNFLDEIILSETRLTPVSVFQAPSLP